MSTETLAQLTAELKAAQTRQQIAEAELATDTARRKLADAARAGALDAVQSAAAARQKAAEADAAAVKAYLPAAATLKPLEGTVTSDDKAGVAAEIAAYAAVSRIAAEVGNAVATLARVAGVQRVLVVADRNVAMTDWQYRAVAAQLDLLLDDLTRTNAAVIAALPDPPPPVVAYAEAPEVVLTGVDAGIGAAGVLPTLATGQAVRKLTAGAVGTLAAGALTAGSLAAGPLAALAGLPAIVGAAADVAGYFQSNYSLAGRAFDASADSVLAALAGAISERGTATIVDGLHRFPPTQVLEVFAECMAMRTRLADARIRLEDRLAAAAPGTPPAPVDQLALDRVKGCEQRADVIITALAGAGTGGSVSPLQQAAAHENLHRGAAQASHVLSFSISAAGGETQTRMRRFFAPVVHYVGGVVINVLVARVDDGTIVHAGSYPAMTTLTYRLKDGAVVSVDTVDLDVPRRR